MDIMIEELDGGLWVAATKDGQLYGLEIDPGREAVRWGSIYWAKVTRIDRTLDAAFVSLDGVYEGFLANKDVRLKGADGAMHKGGAQPIGKILKPGQMIAVQAKSGYLERPDDFDVMREEKYATVSMDITLQGRFLIYAPYLDGNQISSRVRGKKLREQLTEMMNGFAPLKGLILRSSSEDTQRDILLREAKILQSAWEGVEPTFTGDAPRMIMTGPDAFMRTIGDQTDNPIERIEAITMERFSQAEQWCSVFGPDLVPKIHAVELDDPDAELALFDYRGLLGDIEDLFQDYALLSGGGSIIIQETAALTAIDVNRGGDNRPALALNTEAAKEIARQIRLRNIGGILLIDFLKGAGKEDQKTFLKSLTDIFDTDPCTVQIHGFTALGLVEITRKRRTPPLSERLDNVESLNGL
ncbi:MAG: ribonuclease E [Micavibrio aeruginosavorus]|uniref:Ribonuclease E n=1 Tax=Micavibrio aeruginosavorus TaxID=349221 RepID=A0A2W4ZZH6_9BACT|nr:MAG: ribonuclease E [Micavibrio aeruginosavorus]